MPLATRGSPLRELLLLGTCLALVLPAPAVLAAPAPLPDWGSAAKPKPAPPAEAAPAPAPAPAEPSPPPAVEGPADAPAADAEDDVVLTDSSPTPTRSAKKARRAVKPAKVKPAKAKVAVSSSVERAAAERTPIQEHARTLEAAGKLDEAVKSLMVGAEAYHDPVLHLAAAEGYLKLGQAHGRAGVADDDACLSNIRTAQELLKTTPAEAQRVDPEEHAALVAWGDDMARKAEKHKARMGVRRTGHGQIIAGAVLTTAGLAGLGVMSGGLYYNSVSRRELAKGEGRPEEELQPLRDQQKRGETMIAAGAVLGAVGLALGIALVSLGARDLKAARTETLQARVRVAPTLGGLVLVGRF
jgi:hypothetical protein